MENNHTEMKVQPVSAMSIVRGHVSAGAGVAALLVTRLAIRWTGSRRPRPGADPGTREQLLLLDTTGI